MTEYNIYNSIKEKYNNSNIIARKISKNDYIKFVDLIKTPDDAQIKNFIENVLEKIDPELLKNLLDGLPDDGGENSLRRMFENIIRNNNKFKNLYYFSNYTFIKVLDEVVSLNKRNTETMIKYVNDATTTTEEALKSSSNNVNNVLFKNNASFKNNVSLKLAAKDKEIEDLKKQLTIERNYTANLKISFEKIKINLSNLNSEIENSSILKETVNIVKNNIEEAESLAHSLNITENNENNTTTSGGSCKKCTKKSAYTHSQEKNKRKISKRV